jgi:hypothetical protein
MVHRLAKHSASAGRWGRGFAGAWLETWPWLRYVAFVLAAGLVVPTVFMVIGMRGGERGTAAAVGVAVMVVGVAYIFLAPWLADLREQTPLLFRIWDEGASGMVDYGPGTYRFSGSLIVGIGMGMFAWGVFPSAVVAIVVGIVTVLCVWVWTWFAFPQVD